MEDINLKDIIHMFIKRWWIIIVFAILSVGIAYIWTNYYTIPTYAAYTTLYVGKNIDQVGIQTSDLSLGTNLIQDYREIAKSKLVSNEVIKQLELSNISAGALASRVSVTQKNETRVIQISVSDTDPKRATDITNAVAEVFKEKVKEIMQIENVQIIDAAELPTYPVSPNRNRNLLMGFVVGLVLGSGIILLIELLDNNIKTPEDVQKYIDLPVIGAIPEYNVKGGRI